jgi:outer membrane protein assembly factor BamB
MARRLVLLVLLGPACLAQAGDWPHLRGPGYDAISDETGLAVAWGESGPPRLWTRELGQGYSGFVAVGEKVWTQVQTHVAMYVLCLEADTGVEIWRQRVGWPWQAAGAYPGPYATPTWYAGRIYYATPTGQVGCLEADTGRARWSVELRQRFGGKGTGFGYAATPLVEDGRVLLPVGGTGASVVALDADTGATRWAVGDDPASYCPLYPITVAGRRQIVAYLQNSVSAHDPATGQLLWREALSSDYDEHSAWPLFADGKLLLSAPFRAGARLYHVGPDSVKTAWLSRELSNDVCSSVLFRGQVYGFDLHQLQASAHRTSRGRFKCLDFATGQLRWQTDRVGHATVVVADGKLLLLNDTGTLIVGRARAEQYEELSRAKLLSGGICWTPPTLAHGRLFLRNHHQACCVFLGAEADRPEGAARAAVALPPLEFDRTWLFPHEPEFPHDAPTAIQLRGWFVWIMGGVFGPALLMALGVILVRGWLRRPDPARGAGLVLAGTAFVLGLLGTTAFSLLADDLVLTWPASLYVAFRVTVGTITWAENQPDRRVPRRWSRAMGLGFFLLCLAYYQVCLLVGYVVVWCFLAGFLPGLPFVALAARQKRLPWALLLDTLGFTVFFWSAGLLPWLKSHTG